MTGRPSALREFLQMAGPARLLRLAYLKTLRERAQAERSRARLNLALQGGGALGAFTWGVLDRMCEEPGLRIGAISGASAGALNGAVFITGLIKGGPPRAARALKAFWTEISNAAALANLILAPMMLGARQDAWQHAFRNAPGLGVNALADILPRHVDFGAIRAPGAPRFYVSATNVLTTAPHIFTNETLSLDALLASACVPTLHPTVWVDGVPYWDGGFSANPAVAPLLHGGGDRTLLVRLLRAATATAPKDTVEIDTQIKTILFSRPLEEELARIARADPASFARIDEIDATAYASTARLTSHPTPHLVQGLFADGRAAAGTYFNGLRSHAAAGDDAAAPDVGIPAEQRALS